MSSHDFAIGPGHTTLDADNVEIVSVYNKKPTYSLSDDLSGNTYYHPDKDDSDRNSAIYLESNGGSVTIKADTVRIATVDKDGNTAEGVMAISNSAESQINIEAKKSLTIQGDIGFSPVNIKKAEYQFENNKQVTQLSEEESKINLAIEGKDAVMDIKGTVTTYNNSEEGKVNVNSVSLTATGGATIKTNAAIGEKGRQSDGSATETSGVKVNLSNSIWNIGGSENNVNTVSADNANINLGENKATVNQLTSNEGGANITLSGTQAEQLVLNNSSGTGTTTIQTNDTAAKQVVLKNNTADIKMNLSQEASDKVGDNLQTVANMVDASANTGNKGVTATLAEGDVVGERTVDINSNGQVASVTEAKNEVMESLKDIGSNNFLGFRAQMNDLDKRMGDLRTMPDTDGAWARVIAGQSQYKSSHNTYQTLQIGADHRIGNFILGGMASYTDGDGTQKNGSTDDKNYSFGLYGAWLGDDGQFIDVTLKRHHTESDYDLRYTNGTRAKGSLDTSGTSISAEYGWRLGIEGTNYYIEPQVEIMYGHMNSFGYKTSNGVKVSQDAIKTAVGRIGMAAGWVDPNKAGSAYLKVSVLNDWEGDSYSKATKGISSRKYHEDMGGTWVEYAIGGTYNLSKNLSIYGEAETTSGNPVRTTYQVSAGMRYSF